MGGGGGGAPSSCPRAPRPLKPLHVLIPTSYNLYVRPVTLPFDPGWGLGDRLLLCFVLASAVLTDVGPFRGPWFVGGVRLFGPGKL